MKGCLVSYLVGCVVSFLVHCDLMCQIHHQLSLRTSEEGSILKKIIHKQYKSEHGGSQTHTNTNPQCNPTNPNANKHDFNHLY